MMRRVILHLGDTKTGSTSLQHALRVHHLPPAWLYPGRQLNHNGLAQSLTRAAQRSQSDMKFSRVWVEAKDKGIETVVLSAEQFQAVEPTELHEKIKSHWGKVDLELYTYLRPHAEKILAMFSERARLGRHPQFEAYVLRVMKSGKLDYAPRVNKWKRVFGEAFRCRSYPRPVSMRQDVVSDFWSWATLPGAPETTDKQTLNVSLTVGQIALLRRVAQTVKPSPVFSSRSNYRYITARLRSTKLGQDTPKLGFSGKMARQIAERYREDAISLARAHLVEGSLLDQLSDGVQASLRGPADFCAETYFSAEDLRRFDVQARGWVDELQDTPWIANDWMTRELRRVYRADAQIAA